MSVTLAAKLIPFLVSSQAISGTLGATFEGFNMYGVPSVRLRLTLQCSLTCPASAPDLHFRVGGGVNATFVNSPTDSSAYISAFFGDDQTGMNDAVFESFKPGSVNDVKAKSCSCHCGNRTGEGGYIDLVTSVVVPAGLSTAYIGKAGEMSYGALTAAPKGPETVVVTVVGAGGLNTTQTYSPADFATSTSAQIKFTPLAAGDVTITATMQPSGAMNSIAFPVAASNMPSGGGSGSTGGGSGSTGGGGGDANPSAGCSSAGLAPFAMLVLGLLRRRSGLRHQL